jgi:hypothetical protein
LGDWLPLRTYFLTSRASPNDARIVIVIIIGEAELVLHGGGIIAQTYFPVEIYPGAGSCESACFSSKKPPQYTCCARSNHEVKKQNMRLEFEAVVKPASLVETQWPSGAGNVIGARVTFEKGKQAAIRGKVRRKQVDEGKGKQPDH